MTYSPEHDHHLEELLSTLTDAVLMENDIDVLMHESHQAHPELAGLVDIIRKLSRHLTSYTPDEPFTHALRQDLIGGDDGVFSRLRAVPFRVQIATGLAAIAAGIMFLLRRRMQEDDERVEEIMPAL